jgi:hypothetical protein
MVVYITVWPDFHILPNRGRIVSARIIKCPMATGTPQNVIPAVLKPESRPIKENLEPG